MVSTIQGASFDQLPQAFNQVEVGRARGKEQECDAQLPRQCLDCGVVLLAGVVQHQRGRSRQIESKRAVEKGQPRFPGARKWLALSALSYTMSVGIVRRVFGNSV